MPDSEPPRGDLTADDPDLLRKAAELVAETPRLVAEAHEQVRWSQELRLVAEYLCSDRRPGAVTSARRPARSR
jgi:hypothetical protein